jgi:uncharacterized protein YjbJ (UPF0337 family)
MIQLPAQSKRHLICESIRGASAKLFSRPQSAPRLGCDRHAAPLEWAFRIPSGFRPQVVLRSVSLSLGANIMSTQEKVFGNWNQFKGKVKQRWGQLTDDELNEVEGNFDQLVGLVQQKTGEARQQIERAINDLSNQAGGAFTEATETARQYVDQASEKLRGTADQIRERTQGYAEDAQAMVRNRPAESVAVAFGAGLIVGLIVGMVANSRD